MPLIVPLRSALRPLERFRLRTGDYPAALAQLVPSQLKELPIDPWSGNPLCYKRIHPAADAQHRAFLLYGVGANLTDDGGIAPVNPSNRYYVLTQPNLSDGKPGVGFDFVLNDQPR